MNYSVREAKANFAHALTLAASGERVVITKYGKPFAEIVPPTPVAGTEDEDFWVKAARIREELGIKPDDYDHGEDFTAWFNDPALSRRLLGIKD